MYKYIFSLFFVIVITGTTTYAQSDCFTVNVACGSSWIATPKILNTKSLDVVITQHCLFKLPAGAYFQTVYTLTSAPDGMSINSSTGVISWRPLPPLLEQTFTVSVKVDHCEFLNGQNVGSYGTGYCSFSVIAQYSSPGNNQ